MGALYKVGSLILGLLLSAQARAVVVRVDELPKLVVESQDLLVRQSVCQNAWRDIASETGSQKISLNSTTDMYVVPCAKWAVNFGTSIYVTVKESSNPDGFVTLPMRFASYNSYQGLIGQDQVHNLMYLEDEQILLSSFYNDHTGICGTKAAYKWNQGQQKFLLIELQKQDDCRDSSSPWQKINLNF